MRLPVASEFEFAAHTMGLRKYHNRVGSIYMYKCFCPWRQSFFFIHYKTYGDFGD